MFRFSVLGFGTSIWASLLLTPCVSAKEPSLPQKAEAILEKHCAECHGAAGDGGFNYASDLTKVVEGRKVIAGDPGASRIVKLIKETDANAKMPKSFASNPVVDPKDLAILEQWIREGAKPVAVEDQLVEPDRLRVSNFDVYEAIGKYLKRLDPSDRPFQRFYSLHHLHNLPVQKMRAAKLRLV